MWQKVSSYQKPFHCFAIHWCSFIYAQSSVFYLVKSFVWNWQTAAATKTRTLSVHRRKKKTNNNEKHHLISLMIWLFDSKKEEWFWIAEKKITATTTWIFVLSFFVSLFGFIRLLNVLRVLQVLNERSCLLFFFSFLFVCLFYCNCCCCYCWCCCCYLFVWIISWEREKKRKLQWMLFACFLIDLNRFRWNRTGGNRNKVLSRIEIKEQQQRKCKELDRTLFSSSSVCLFEIFGRKERKNGYERDTSPLYEHTLLHSLFKA